MERFDQVVDRQRAASGGLPPKRSSICTRLKNTMSSRHCADDDCHRRRGAWSFARACASRSKARGNIRRRVASSNSGRQSNMV